MDGEIVIPLLDRRLAVRNRLHALQDGIGIVALVPAALARLGDGRPVDVALAAIEIAAAIGVLVAVARELRGHAHGSGASRTNVLSGLVMLADGGFRVAHGHHLLNPQILLGLALVTIGFAGPSFLAGGRGRRGLRLDGRRVRVRLSPLRRLDVSWHDVEALEVGDDRIRFRTRRGGPALRLRYYENTAQIRDGLIRAARAVGVPVVVRGAGDGSTPRPR